MPWNLHLPSNLNKWCFLFQSSFSQMQFWINRKWGVILSIDMTTHIIIFKNWPDWNLMPNLLCCWEWSLILDRTWDRCMPQMIPSTVHIQKLFMEEKKKRLKFRITWSWYKTNIYIIIMHIISWLAIAKYVFYKLNHSNHHIVT